MTTKRCEIKFKKSCRREPMVVAAPLSAFHGIKKHQFTVVNNLRGDSKGFGTGPNLIRWRDVKSDAAV